MFDAVIVGGSYAGLSAAMQLGRARRKVCIVDAGKPRNRFSDASHGFFGQDGAAPAAMIDQAREQVLAYPTVTFVSDMALVARREDAHFVVGLASGNELKAQRMLLAHGVEDHLPDLPGLEERWGHSVIHCPYCHGYEFAGQQLGVLYSVPASLHQALLIPDWGPTTLFLNGAEMPDEESLQALDRRGVAIEPEAIAQLEGDAPAIDGVELADGRCLPLDALYIAPRTHFCSLAEQLGCEFEEGPTGWFIRTDEWKLTSEPGVYAAGDAAQPAGNATLATAAGALAGGALHHSLIFAGL